MALQIGIHMVKVIAPAEEIEAFKKKLPRLQPRGSTAMGFGGVITIYCNNLNRYCTLLSTLHYISSAYYVFYKNFPEYGGVYGFLNTLLQVMGIRFNGQSLPLC
jgi:hypothetical protein